jgi:hypothetical protein
MGEGADSLLPCRHAILIIRAAKTFATQTSPLRLRHSDFAAQTSPLRLRRSDFAVKTSPLRLRWNSIRFGAATAPRNAYITLIGAESTSEHAMVFRPNFGRDRAERARAARSRSEEKQRKKDEKTELRKAKRAEMNPGESNPPPDETQTPDETQS